MSLKCLIRSVNQVLKEIRGRNTTTIVPGVVAEAAGSRPAGVRGGGAEALRVLAPQLTHVAPLCKSEKDTSFPQNTLLALYRIYKYYHIYTIHKYPFITM